MNPIQESKRTLSLIRASFWIIVLEAIVIIVLAVLIIFLFPLKENIPYLVRFSSLENSFVTVEKADSKLRANKALIKFLLDAYVVNRESIDRATHNIRRANVLIFSSFEETQRYEEHLLSLQTLIETENIFREIKTINIVHVSSSVAIVEFSITDKQNTSIVAKSKAKATIRYYFQDIKLPKKTMLQDIEEVTGKSLEAYKNPIGLLVREYQITSIQND